MSLLLLMLLVLVPGPLVLVLMVMRVSDEYWNALVEPQQAAAIEIATTAPPIMVYFMVNEEVRVRQWSDHR